MTLRLSDDQLARLRADLLLHVELKYGGLLPDTRREIAADLESWCLRDRPVEPEET